MIFLPDKTKMMWEQNNRSDIIGTLWSSFCLNLTDQLGKTKVATRMVVTTNGTTNLGTPFVFKKLGSVIYALCGNYLFSSTGGTFTQLGSESSFVSAYNDLEVFNNKLYATESGELIKLNGSGVATTLQALTTLTPHKLLNFHFQNRLYIADAGIIYSMNTSESVATSGDYTFTLQDSSDAIVGLLETTNLIWILTMNPANNLGHIYSWDGGTTANAVSNFYPLDTFGALAGIIWNGTPYIIDVSGKLLYFNGQAFVLAPNGRLPIKQGKYLNNSLATANNRWIHPNGITLVDNRINILINNLNDDGTTIQESLPSGVWEYDETIGWYHKYALTQYDYYGAATISDYGQNRLSAVGALSAINTSIGNLLVGADYFVDGSTTKSATFSNELANTIQKFGYLVSTKILAATAQESWQKSFMKIRPLLNATDKIFVKYRSNDDVATEANITWVNSTSFTTTTNVLAYAPTINQAVGGEVEITQGSGGGFCSHITRIDQSVSGNTITQTVTLEDAFPSTASGTAKARFQSWNKLGSFNQQNLDLVEFGDMSTSTWLQIKVCFLFTGNNELVQLMIENSTFQ